MNPSPRKHVRWKGNPCDDCVEKWKGRKQSKKCEEDSLRPNGLYPIPIPIYALGLVW